MSMLEIDAFDIVGGVPRDMAASELTSPLVKPVILQKPSEQKIMWHEFGWLFATTKLRSEIVVRMEKRRKKV